MIPVLRQKEAHEATQCGQQHGLGEKLADEPRSAGSKRSTHRYLPLTRTRPRQEQAGNVGAGNQQYQPN